jgi:hypothetical protein
MEKLKVYCPYSALELGWERIKELPNVTFEKPWYLEYNTDKSAEHPTNEGEDIVRYSFEKRRVQDKELVYNDFESK